MIKDLVELLGKLPEWNRLLKLPAEVQARQRVYRCSSCAFESIQKLM